MFPNKLKYAPSLPTLYLIGWLAYYTIIFINVVCCSTKSIISVGKTPVVVFWLENVSVFCVFVDESTFFSLNLASKSIKIASIFSDDTVTNTLAYYTVVFIDDPWWSTKSIISVGKTPVVVCWLENVSVFVFLLNESTSSI